MAKKTTFLAAKRFYCSSLSTSWLFAEEFESLNSSLRRHATELRRCTCLCLRSKTASAGYGNGCQAIVGRDGYCLEPCVSAASVIPRGAATLLPFAVGILCPMATDCVTSRTDSQVTTTSEKFIVESSQNSRRRQTLGVCWKGKSIVFCLTSSHFLNDLQASSPAAFVIWLRLSPVTWPNVSLLRNCLLNVTVRDFQSLGNSS